MQITDLLTLHVNKTLEETILNKALMENAVLLLDM